ncbi:DedA family protein [Marivita sp. S0852]|uniref:DedA family protein n=1 Tax=Marivita sp. S0852 TaxID=3373893 RepID=UPI00398284ED
MSETFLSLTATYGVWIVVTSAYLSCLAIPIPTALVMLAAGAFAAAGDLEYSTLLPLAWMAAVLGDQTGYWIGRKAGGRIVDLLSTSAKRKDLIARARQTVLDKGGVGVFFSTWLFAPLGPWVNLTAGVVGLGWLRFTVWDAAGEAIWVTGYLTLGFLFGDQLDALASLMSNLSGFLVAALVTLGLGWMLRNRLSRAHAKAPH